MKSPELDSLSHSDIRAKTAHCWLALLTVVALALRFYALNNQLWIDEYLTLSITSKSWHELLTTFASTNQHPLFTLLAKASMSAFGVHPWSLRLPAALCGVACIPALYFCARQVVARREALWAGALLALSYNHIWFSQNARGYAGIALTSLVTTGCLLAMAKDTPRRREYSVLYAAFMILGIYTHLTAAFILVGHAIAIFFFLWRRWFSSPAKWIALAMMLSLAGSFLLYAPMLKSVYSQTAQPAVARMTQERKPVDASRPTALWQKPRWIVSTAVRGLSGGKNPIALLPPLLLLALGIIGFWREGEEDRLMVTLWVWPAIVTCVTMLALWRFILPRFLFFEIGFATLLIAHGMTILASFFGRLSPAQQSRRRMSTLSLTVIGALVLAGSAWSLPRAYTIPKQDFRGAWQYIATNKKPGDAVAGVHSTGGILHKYFNPDVISVKNVYDLAALKPRQHALWLAYSLPELTKSTSPRLWKMMQNDFEVVKVFPGTLDDGVIFVCRSKAGQPHNKQ